MFKYDLLTWTWLSFQTKVGCSFYNCRPPWSRTLDHHLPRCLSLLSGTPAPHKFLCLSTISLCWLGADFLCNISKTLSNFHIQVFSLGALQRNQRTGLAKLGPLRRKRGRSIPRVLHFPTLCPHLAKMSHAFIPTVPDSKLPVLQGFYESMPPASFPFLKGDPDFTGWWCI
jgi:hypothetical protein